jgi:membrane glycosyltransferase
MRTWDGMMGWGQVEQLTEQRTTLIRNISCVYKTAKAELARKDGMIEDYRRRWGAILLKPYFP